MIDVSNHVQFEQRMAGHCDDEIRLFEKASKPCHETLAFVVFNIEPQSAFQ